MKIKNALAMGGRIEVESKEGVETVFTLWLPVSPPGRSAGFTLTQVDDSAPERRS